MGYRNLNQAKSEPSNVPESKKAFMMRVWRVLERRPLRYAPFFKKTAMNAADTSNVSDERMDRISK